METLAFLLFVAGPLMTGAVLASAVRMPDARGAALAGSAGGMLFGLNLIDFGGFLYGPVLGCVGGLMWYGLCSDTEPADRGYLPVNVGLDKQYYASSSHSFSTSSSHALSSPPNATLIPLTKGIWREAIDDR